MVTRAVTQLYDDGLRPSGLRVTQFSILATIARMGAANLRQLEDTLAIDQTTLTRSLNLLQREGVTERVPHPTGASRRCGSHPKGEEPSRSRGRFGPGASQGPPRAGAERMVLTLSGGWPTCFMSPSRSGG
jgi:hypothetical protein